jgi:uncharacterized protein
LTSAILFARNPVPGRVKTRLQTHLTPEQAASLYGAFLRDTAALLRGCAAASKIVASADDEGLQGLQLLLDPQQEGRLQFTVQQGVDLGRRMEHALKATFTDGAHHAVILGTDSPSLPASTIDDALARLEHVDVVLGPVVDGGYYLIGVTAQGFAEAGTRLFRGIDWSTGCVLEQTVAALSSTQRLALLSPWYDVDHPPEAAFLRTHLEALERAADGRARHSLLALRKLQLPPPS